MNHLSTRSRAGYATAAGAVLVLALGACSGGSTGTSTDDPSSAAEAAMGPLDEFFSEMYGGFDEDAANAQMMQVEESVAACMAEQGFEYTPVDYSQNGGMASSVDELDVEWGTKEFAEQYGYGATTNPYGDPTEDAPTEEWVDPNQDYIETMSETEQTAYYAALYGDQTVAEGETEVEYSWEDAGCQGAAQHEVYDATGMDEDKFTALQDEMTAMYESIAADPRVSELDAQWAACMADAGYTGLAVVGDGETSIYDQVNKIYEDAYADVDTSVEITAEQSEAIDAAVKDQLAAITPVEIETAVADFGCRDEVEYTKTQQDVNAEYQQEFMDAHQAELDAWMAAYQDSQK